MQKSKASHATRVRTAWLKSILTIVSLMLSVTALSNPQSDPHNSNPHKKAGSIDSMTKGLEERLEREPNDMKGWVLLGKSYYHLHRFDDAKAAFEKAKALGYSGDIPKIDSAYHEGKTSDKEHYKAKGGHYHGHHPTHFSALTKAIEAEVKKTPASSEKADSAEGVKIKVDIAPKLKSTLSENNVVYIFARATSGMPAPLAVARRYVRDFPTTIVLNDSMAMMKGHNISSHEEIVVGARVSMSGSPMKQAGDPEALSSKLSSKHEGVVELVIN